MMLAENYDEKQVDLASGDWLVSEKLDGMRAWWDGKGRGGEGGKGSLWTRQGNRIHAPPYFTASFPPHTALDGELWLGRGESVCPSQN